jgi:hypothetical protein
MADQDSISTIIPRTTQATSNNWLGSYALWAMVKPLVENPTTKTPAQQEHQVQTKKQWYRLDDRPYYTDLE